MGWLATSLRSRFLLADERLRRHVTRLLADAGIIPPWRQDRRRINNAGRDCELKETEGSTALRRKMGDYLLRLINSMWEILMTKDTDRSRGSRTGVGSLEEYSFGGRTSICGLQACARIRCTQGRPRQHLNRYREPDPATGWHD